MINSMMTKRLLEKKTKIIPMNHYDAVLNSILSLDIQWAKWLAYEPESEKNLCNSSISITELDIEQLKKLKTMKEQKMYSEIMNKYAFHYDQITKEENILAYRYMQSHSIFDLILQKLTKEELELGNKQATLFIEQSSKEEMKNYLDNLNPNHNLDNYLKMDMVDAYTFYLIARHYALIPDKLSTEILDSELNENLATIRKGWSKVKYNR